MFWIPEKKNYSQNWSSKIGLIENTEGKTTLHVLKFHTMDIRKRAVMAKIDAETMVQYYDMLAEMNKLKIDWLGR